MKMQKTILKKIMALSLVSNKNYDHLLKQSKGPNEQRKSEYSSVMLSFTKHSHIIFFKKRNYFKYCVHMFKLLLK